MLLFSEVKTEGTIFLPHPSLFFSFFPYLQKQGNPSSFLWCAAKRSFLGDMVEGVHDSNGEGTEAIAPPMLPNINKTPSSFSTDQVPTTQQYTDLLSRISRGCLHFWAVMRKGWKLTKKMILWSLSYKLATRKQCFMPTFLHFESLPIHHQLTVPESPPYARLCSGPKVHAMCREYANIPAHGGGSFKFTIIKKTLSLRYFRQCKRLEERLNVAWSGQESLRKGWDLAWGENRKNSDRLGEKGKEFQVNTSVPKGFIMDSKPGLSKWCPYGIMRAQK